MEKLIVFNGHSMNISQDGEMISLTDLWKACGADDSKRPAFWVRQEEAVGFIKATAKFFKCDLKSLLKTAKGRYSGGTWAHVQIALEYAQYLSPDLAVQVNRVFLERLEEEANPELALKRGQERATLGWKRKGKDDK
ncbi:hypothetical protein BWI93_11595 [Siphonobacter sp. BAB-5385]|uniref:KilA-N domain-containing protein n=1 Tax=Siphonobacter sp. BAB-5385 TaxID=1864822 RepID=UPI000B9E26F7|nr:KilA-N domain-containing protein [Siphonobacter sp. BAB-5385]OZI07992.1 hypothetical protein BWI93_11595 [Siphonobacter sp. BAB-5385]